MNKSDKREMNVLAEKIGKSQNEIKQVIILLFESVKMNVIKTNDP